MLTGMVSKLPPKGNLDLIVFDRNTFVLVVRREDGEELGVTLTHEDLENLVEYWRTILDIFK